MNALRSFRRLLALLGILALWSATANGYVSVGIMVGEPPPPLPVYAQPLCPGEGYMWVPGYWAYDDDEGYYWIPGAWALAPEPGLLWTPGYWGWAPGGYVWNAGYWGPHVGFYGGINYGFGYFGQGFTGGYWDHDRFRYNVNVTNINVNGGVRNYYYGGIGATNYGNSRVSFNGGRSGVQARPTWSDQTASRERHFGLTGAQHQHAELARSMPTLAAYSNHGQPGIAAVPRAGMLDGRGASAARGASRNFGDQHAWAAPRTARGEPGVGSRPDANRDYRPPARWGDRPTRAPVDPRPSAGWGTRSEPVRPYDRAPGAYAQRSAPDTYARPSWRPNGPTGGYASPQFERPPAAYRAPPAPSWSAPRMSEPRNFGGPARNSAPPPARGPEPRRDR